VDVGIIPVETVGVFSRSQGSNCGKERIRGQSISTLLLEKIYQVL
jgi:hypothetical protein